MRTAGERKITYGHVVQTFDENGKCIEQEFVAGDHVEWEGDDLEPIDPNPDCECHPFRMIQPLRRIWLILEQIKNIDLEQKSRIADMQDEIDYYEAREYCRQQQGE